MSEVASSSALEAVSANLPRDALKRFKSSTEPTLAYLLIRVPLSLLQVIFDMASFLD